MDTVFFIASKLVGTLIRADTWIVIALGVIVLALVFQWRRLAMGVSALTFAALSALSVLPLGALLLQPIERSFPGRPALSRVDGIIVLGGSEMARASVYWGQTQLNEGGERYMAALALAHRFPEARVLFAGGSGALRDLAGNVVSEASIAAQVFDDQGIAPERMFFEGRSRNTAENARLSRALAEPVADAVWVLITSAFHMPRAFRSFEVAGWSGLVAYPVDYRTGNFSDGVGWNLAGNVLVLNTAIKERIGQMVYWLTGR